MKLFNKTRFGIYLGIQLMLIIICAGAARAQNDMLRDSARSDKLTGGAIKQTQIQPGAGDLKITINVPSFQMTLWQGDAEVKTYPIGVGLKDYPIFVGKLQASAVIWNPSWIPPSSDWVEVSKKVKPGEIILPTDPRNPLGKVKIPLGYGYLIHQAKGVQDLGSLVSHGCARVMQKDLYDLAEKIVAAYALEVSPEQIKKAKSNLVTLTAELEPTIPVVITYDTMVVEAGKLRIYPDVYERGVNTVDKLRAELESNGIETSDLSEATMKKIIARAADKKQFVVSVKNIEAGRTLAAGQTTAVVAAPIVKTPIKRKAGRRS